MPSTHHRSSGLACDNNCLSVNLNTIPGAQFPSYPVFDLAIDPDQAIYNDPPGVAYGQDQVLEF